MEAFHVQVVSTRFFHPFCFPLNTQEQRRPVLPMYVIFEYVLVINAYFLTAVPGHPEKFPSALRIIMIIIIMIIIIMDIFSALSRMHPRRLQKTLRTNRGMGGTTY